MSLPHNGDRRKSNCGTNECAVLTAAGRSAIAVIGLRGPQAAAIVAQRFASASRRPLSPGEIRYGQWASPHQPQAASESVVLTPLAEDHFEIHCHGGPAAIERIVGDLKAGGANQIDSDDWMSADRLLIREAREVLSRCLTARTAAIAMDQLRGAMHAWTTTWAGRIHAEPESLDLLLRQAAQIEGGASLGTRLAEPFRVVLVGPPNVGKSSLVNAIVGFERSITDHTAGTTRDVLHAETVIDGLPIRLSDTAGLRDSDEPIEREGVTRARAAAETADLVLHVTEPAIQPSAVSDWIAKSSPSRSTPGRVLQVLNKSDLLSPDSVLPTPDLIPTNALTGAGIEELIAAMADALSQSLPLPGEPVAITDRQATILTKIAASTTEDEVTALLRELLG